ncbi:MAG: prepilin-type N-terminal cleavage/methylation domain-containing protein [Elusimicrobiota bacterium]|jgi:prepilin-type N-terminal cleavage/methylation domain-containing protein|nr:prepilin-type N-terminal cleavage/methylation domain-containing protein [Elusimicrobiota bacterium]
MSEISEAFMPNKKGFTLLEILVVIVVIAILSLLAMASYKRARVTSQNEMARVKLVEVAAAAQMYNEDARGENRVAGGFGRSPVANFQRAELLFSRTATNDISASTYSYLKNKEWNQVGACAGGGNDCVLHYRGYNFYVCNPDSTSTAGQPAGSGCDGKMIATMTGPTCSGSCSGATCEDGVNPQAVKEYCGKKWWVSRENLGAVGSDYGG